MSLTGFAATDDDSTGDPSSTASGTKITVIMCPGTVSICYVVGDGIFQLSSAQRRDSRSRPCETDASVKTVRGDVPPAVEFQWRSISGSSPSRAGTPQDFGTAVPVHSEPGAVKGVEHLLVLGIWIPFQERVDVRVS
jgi:hypothetical protein